MVCRRKHYKHNYFPFERAYDPDFPYNHDGAGSNFAGILSGKATNSTLDTIKIIDCHVEVHRDFSSIGGVVGEINNVTVKVVSVDGLHLEGNGDMGGITGKAHNSNFQNSGIISAGPILHHSVTSNRSVGGITGYSFNTNYTECVILFLTMELRGNMNAQTSMGFFIGYMDCGIIENAVVLLVGKTCNLPANPNGWEARYFKFNQGLIGHKIGTTSVSYNNF